MKFTINPCCHNFTAFAKEYQQVLMHILYCTMYIFFLGSDSIYLEIAFKSCDNLSMYNFWLTLH